MAHAEDRGGKHVGGREAHFDGDDNPLHAKADKGVKESPQYEHTEELEDYFSGRFLGSKPSVNPNGGK